MPKKEKVRRRFEQVKRRSEGRVDKRSEPSWVREAVEEPGERRDSEEDNILVSVVRKESREVRGMHGESRENVPNWWV